MEDAGSRGYRERRLDSLEVELQAQGAYAGARVYDEPGPLVDNL